MPVLCSCLLKARTQVRVICGICQGRWIDRVVDAETEVGIRIRSLIGPRNWLFNLKRWRVSCPNELLSWHFDVYWIVFWQVFVFNSIDGLSTLETALEVNCKAQQQLKWYVEPFWSQLIVFYHPQVQLNSESDSESESNSVKLNLDLEKTESQLYLTELLVI